MTRQIPKKRKGSIDRSETFDEFLAKDGLLAETEDAAVKEIIADQIKIAMNKQHLSKTAMAARMKTSRRQLDRLLDPNNPSVTLATFIVDLMEGTAILVPFHGEAVAIPALDLARGISENQHQYTINEKGTIAA